MNESTRSRSEHSKLSSPVGVYSTRSSLYSTKFRSPVGVGEANKVNNEQRKVEHAKHSSPVDVVNNEQSQQRTCELNKTGERQKESASQLNVIYVLFL